MPGCAGVNNCTTDGYGYSPLHLVAMTGKSVMACFLLAKGAQVNLKSVDGYTPLHLALLRKDRAGVHLSRLLIENGADVNCRDGNGDTPYAMALSCRHWKTASLLRKQAQCGDSPEQQLILLLQELFDYNFINKLSAQPGLRLCSPVFSMF